MTTDWPETNPYYQAYCIAHGASSRTEMLERDRARFPGGCLAGFMGWISLQWAEWRTETRHVGNLSADDRTAFGSWLADRSGSLDRENRKPT